MNDGNSTALRFAPDRRRFTLGLPLLVAAAAGPRTAFAANAPAGDKPPIVTHHRTKTIDGIKIFYREAGRPAPRSCCSCTASRPRPTCSGI